MASSPRSSRMRTDGYFRVPSQQVNRVFAQFNELRKEGKLLDYRIILSDNKELSCHRVVICASCPYFSKLFDFQAKQSQGVQDSTDLSDLDSYSVEQVVGYWYGDQLNINDSNEQLKDFIQVCDYLQLDSLKTECIRFIVEKLSPNNCISWYGTARDCLLYMNVVAERSFNIILSKFQEVKQSNEFLEIEKDHLIEILDSEISNVCNEDVIFDAALTWLRFSDNRREFVPEVLAHVRLCYCSVDLLYTSAQNDDLLETVQSQRIINEALMRKSCPNSSPLSCCKPRKCYEYKKAYLIVYNGRSAWICIEDKWYDKGLEIPNGDSVDGSGCMFEDNIFINSRENCFLYNISSDKISELPLMPNKNISHKCIAYGECIYVIGGQSERQSVKTVQCLHVASRKWYPCADMIYGVTYPILARVKHKIYVINSSFPINFDADDYDQNNIHMQCYDVYNNKWFLKNDLPREIRNTQGMSAVSIDDYIYLLGGEERTLNRYDTKTEQWSQLASCIHLHCFSQAAVDDNKIVLLGGSDPNKSYPQTTDCIEEYDVENDEWSEASIKLPDKMEDNYGGIVYLSSERITQIMILNITL